MSELRYSNFDDRLSYTSSAEDSRAAAIDGCRFDLANAVRAKAVGLKSVTGARRGRSLTWPYGPNIHLPMREQLLTWAEQRSLRLVGYNCERDCLHWLAKGQCSAWRCGRDDQLRYDDVYDHGTAWLGPRYGTGRRDQVRVLVMQPYTVSFGAVEALRAKVQPLGLTVEVGPAPYYFAPEEFEVHDTEGYYSRCGVIVQHGPTALDVAA